MNKIYLDKLCEFTLTTYKNYELNNKNFNLEDIIKEIKQNNSLNEKGIFIKHKFIELKLLVSFIEYDHLILINPLCFNLYGNIEWFNFLNALLTVLNDDYLHENNLIKKTILETADKTFKKKIMVDNIIDNFNNIIENICNLTNIKLFLINDNNIQIFNDNYKTNKILVFYKHKIEYYPVINWNQKYFNINSEFVNYLNQIKNELNLNNNPKIIINNLENIINNNNNNNNKKKNKLNVTNKLKKIINNIDELDELDDLDENNLEEKNIKTKDYYEERIADKNYAIYISEAIDNNMDKKKKINISDTKKKNKKNIFVSQQSTQQIKNNLNNDKDSSVFVKTEKIEKNNIKDIEEISLTIKSSMNLEQIQSYALKLNINIFEGSTKSGKPKNKTKSDLIEQIKQFIKNKQEQK